MANFRLGEKALVGCSLSAPPSNERKAVARRGGGKTLSRGKGITKYAWENSVRAALHSPVIAVLRGKAEGKVKDGLSSMLR